MTKISSTSSVTNKRIRSNFVRRNRTSGSSISGVNPVNPVTPVVNNASYSSSNLLLSSDIFYDKLEKLKKEYLNFYHHERNLKKAINDIEENMDLDLKHIKNLVNKYNKAAIALETFDKEIHTNHSQNIKEILHEYEPNLNDMGIYIVKENQLDLNEETFKINLMLSKDNLDQSLKPIRKMILKLYKRFRNIQCPNREDLDSKYDDFHNRDYSGIIMDKKR